MGASLDVKVHIDLDYRDDQNEGDDFELYIPHHDSWWLSETELVGLRDKIDKALLAYRSAKAVIAEGEEDGMETEPTP